MSIENNFDVSFVAGIALREKQIQQNYRPIIAVHKWFARRPGTLFRALMLAEFASGALREKFFESNSLSGIRVGDPFMGGGTPLFEANRLGCDVVGFDVNPMAYWIVRQELEWLDLDAYQAAASKLLRALEKKLGVLYRTRCIFCSRDTPVKYFLWVKTQDCISCKSPVDLFPGYLVSEDRRHPKNVVVCADCGELSEVEDCEKPGNCRVCSKPLSVDGPAKRSRCPCRKCGAENRFPRAQDGAPRHRMFAIEYHCPHCRPGHRGRFFKKPDDEDVAQYVLAQTRAARMRPAFIPSEAIPPGDETDRLHRWGYKLYREMFNDRQLLGLETAARLISAEANERVRNALATNLSDLLRYQNMLCRYDSMALKSLDIFSVHGFPVGLIQCESNFLGIANGREQPELFDNGDSTGNVGSGGWTNIIDKYAKAKAYCARPFEVYDKGQQKVIMPISGEWIGEARSDRPEAGRRDIQLTCRTATESELSPASLDAVFTDPPYFKNVQYAELMDFCYVWLRRLLPGEPAFQAVTTRSPVELTGNQTMDRGFEHFAEGMSDVFTRMARALKPGAPLVFTYHNNDLAAYYPLAVAILDSGLVCTATLPCPTEMAASIHISGTSSSVVDSIFVCRHTRHNQRTEMCATPAVLASDVGKDIEALRSTRWQPSQGDIRCITFGHLVRAAIYELQDAWVKTAPIQNRLATIATWIRRFGGSEAVEAALTGRVASRKTSKKKKSARGARNAQVPV